MRNHRLFGVVTSFCCVVLLCAAWYTQKHGTKKPSPGFPQLIASPIKHSPQVNIPRIFEPNLSQGSPDVQFFSRTGRSTLFATHHGILWNWENADGHPKSRGGVTLTPEGSGSLQWEPRGKLQAHANYFIGKNPRNWRTDVPLYSALRARNVYQGIDWLLYINGRDTEYDLVLAPNAAISDIRLSLRGAAGISIDKDGDITGSGVTAQFRMHKPIAYQMKHNQKVAVDVRYALKKGNDIGFDLGQYDRRIPLVIDPTISISYDTFLGGTGADSANSIALDSFGVAYVGGTTTSPLFPETGAINEGPLGGPSDFFVAKINPNLTGSNSLLYLTYIGGTGDEEGGAIAVDSSQNVVIAGSSTSTDFPVVNPQQSTLNGASDIVIAKLNGDGNSLVFSTYFGGSGAESTQGYVGATVDSAGNIYVTSDTASADLPVTASSFQATYGGGTSDGFFAIFTPTGSLSYCTYFGIDATVGATGITADNGSPANVYVSGFTSQPVGTSFPTVNAFQNAYGGGTYNGFVMKFSPLSQGSSDLIYASLLGGSVSDQALAIAVDTASPPNAYVAGSTQSSDFPVSGTNAGFQTTLTGTSNAFLSVIAQNAFTNATSLAYSTYLGGGGDTALSVFVIAPSAVYLAGKTTSSIFPTLATLQSFTGTSDAFLAKFDTTQSGISSLLYSALFGGETDAGANGVAATSNGTVLLAGSTTSNDFPVAGNPQNGFQIICESCGANPPLSDAFITGLAEANSSGPLVSFGPPTANFGSQPVGSQTVPPQFVSITNAGTTNLVISSLQMAGVNASDFSLEFSYLCAGITLTPGSKCSFEIGFVPSIVGKETADVEVIDNAPASPQSLPVLGEGAGALAAPSPTSVTFASQPINTTSNGQIVTLLNNGTSPLVINGISLGGANPTAFILQPAYSCTGQGGVPGGSNCVITVSFAPKTVGMFSAEIDIIDNSDNVPNSEQIIPLNGNGTAAAAVAVLTPASLTFGGEAVGTPSGSQSILVENSGSLALQFSGIAISGANASDFNLVPGGTTCSLAGQGVAPNSTCTIAVNFGPTSNGARSAALSLSDNASPSTQEVPLLGSGFSPGITLSSSSLSFGNENVNARSSAQTITLSSTGNSTLTIFGFAFVGANNSDFSQNNNCRPTLATGSNCVISVVFDPQGNGSRSAALSIQDSAVGSPQLISLSGTGLGTTASLSPASLSFPAQLVGTSSAVLPVTLTNTGAASLSASSISFSGTNPAEFSETDNCTASISPSGSCTINVAFKPAAGGGRNATMNVTDNAAGGSQSVSLSGTADDFSITVASGASASATLSSSQPAVYNLQVNPLSGFAGSIAVSCSGVPAGASCSPSPSSMAVSGVAAVPFTVNLATTTTGRIAGPRLRPHNGPYLHGPDLLRVLWILLSVSALVSLAGAIPASPRFRRLRLSLALGLGLALGACAASSTATNQDPVAPGTYTITITGSAQGGTRSVNLTLTAQGD